MIIIFKHKQITQKVNVIFKIDQMSEKKINLNVSVSFGWEQILDSSKISFLEMQYYMETGFLVP